MASTYRSFQALSEVLRAARRDAGLTQAQLAKKLKTRQSGISCAESGNVSSIRFAHRWVEACGTRLVFYHIGYLRKVGQGEHGMTVFARED